MDAHYHGNVQAYGGIPQPPSANDDSVMRRRWESEELVDSLWLLLAGQERYQENGQVKLRAAKDVTALMNLEGAGRVIQVIRAFINPVVSLSRLSDEDARLLFYSAQTDVMNAIVLNKDEWGVKHDADLYIIKATTQTVLFSQIMRAVNGWEGNNSKTQIVESSSTQTTRDSSGFRIPGFGGK